LLNVVQDCLQVERQRRIEFDAAAVCRVREGEACGMEEGALEPLNGAEM
jgi:hypothetical protein